MRVPERVEPLQVNVDMAEGVSLFRRVPTAERGVRLGDTGVRLHLVGRERADVRPQTIEGLVDTATGEIVLPSQDEVDGDVTDVGGPPDVVSRAFIPLGERSLLPPVGEVMDDAQLRHDGLRSRITRAKRVTV